MKFTDFALLGIAGLALATTDCNEELKFKAENKPKLVEVRKKCDRKIEDLCKAEFRALLDTIAYAEGTNNHYNIMFGGRTFSDYSAHPTKTREMSRRGIRFGRRNRSTAAGRYQFLARTYHDLKRKGLFEDFSAEEQDEAALYLIKRKRKVSEQMLEIAIKRKNFDPVWYQLSKEWASLPHPKTGRSRYRKQKSVKKEILNQQYLTFYQEHKLMGY